MFGHAQTLAARPPFVNGGNWRSLNFVANSIHANIVSWLEIWVTREGSVSGPYTIDRARWLMQEGMLLPDDYAYHEGLRGWTSLTEVLVALPESAVPQRPWCQKCQNYPMIVWKRNSGWLADMDRRNRRDDYRRYRECMNCGSNPWFPHESLNNAKFGAWLFFITIGLGLLFLAFESYEYYIISEIIFAILLLVGFFNLAWFIPSILHFRRYYIWKSWDKKHR